MLVYETIDKKLVFFTSPEYLRVVSMGLKPVLSKYITTTDVEKVLIEYDFILTQTDFIGKDENKPKARLYTHKSLKDGSRVILLDTAADMEKVIADALFEISKITLVYNNIYTPISIETLANKIIESKRVKESTTDGDAG